MTADDRIAADAGAPAPDTIDLETLSTVSITGTHFLELEGRHPAGSLEDMKLKFTRRVIFVARRWRNRINDELRKTGHSHARWMTLMWIHLLGGQANHRELAERIGVELPTPDPAAQPPGGRRAGRTMRARRSGSGQDRPADGCRKAGPSPN